MLIVGLAWLDSGFANSVEENTSLGVVIMSIPTFLYELELECDVLSEQPWL